MNTLMRFLIPILLLSLSAGSVSAQSAETLYEVSVSKFLMGTQVETKARHSDIIACKKSLYLAYQEMERIENLLSFHNAGSEVSKINRAAGIHPVRVSPETFAIVHRAKSYARRLDGLFDVSIGPISELWGFNHNRQIAVPEQHEIDACLKLVDYRHIRLDSLHSTVFLNPKGVKIDLGGIAKGYAIDRGVSILKQKGIRHFLLSAGGDIYVSGRKNAHTDWRVGIKHPREMNDLVAQFNLKDCAVATSGDYERYTTIKGRRYHHIIDPRDGYFGTLSQSATVLSATAEEADVLATYLFLLGYERASKDHRLDAPFLIVASDGTVHYNDAFARIADVAAKE